MEKPVSFSRIIAGTMTWGRWGSRFSSKEMASLINHCVAEGITSFDNADIYGDYTTESDFGEAFARSGINREAIQIITKCGIQLTSRDANALKHYNYSKDYIIWSVEQSLQNLKTDYLDLFLLHRPSPLMHPDEIAEAINSLMNTGKIREFGVSNFTPSQVSMIERKTPVSANQIEFSLTHGTPMYDGTLDECMTKEQTAMAWSPLGNYFKGQEDNEKAIAGVLSALCSKYQATESQLLLAWILKHPARIHPVIGTSKQDRLSESIAACSIDIELQDWFALLAASEGHEVP